MRTYTMRNYNIKKNIIKKNIIKKYNIKKYNIKITNALLYCMLTFSLLLMSACGSSNSNSTTDNNNQKNDSSNSESDKDTASDDNSDNNSNPGNQSDSEKDDANKKNNDSADNNTANDGTVTVNINDSETYQTIEGFGAGYTYYSDYVYFAKYKSEVYDLLFKDANLTVLRFKNSYDYDPEKEFNPKVEREFYAEAKKRLEADGLEPKVLMSSWSPAAYLKDSENIYGEGTIAKDKNGNYKYDEYGKYWAKLVKAYAKNEVPIDYLSIQNEPDYVAAYESCSFDFDETPKGAAYSKAFLAVYDAVNKLENPPKMLGPETMSCKADDITLIMNPILDTRPETVYGICHHLYVGGDETKPRSFNPSFTSLNLEYPDLSKWMTEYYRGDFMNTVQIIQNSLLYENLNCYIFWGGVWMGAYDREIDNMIGMDSASEESEYAHHHGYNVGEKYYAMRHFSEYILPDYKRIGSKVNYEFEDSLDTDNLSCSAYKSPDGKHVTLVAINDFDESKKLKFEFDNITVSSSKVILSDYSKKENTEQFYEDAGTLDADNSYDLPAHSIITVVIDC